jgi:hypothetical protein
MKWIVIFGNLVKAIGPFAEYSDAKKYADRFDVSSEDYNPGQWKGYSVTILSVEKPRA